MGFLKKEKRTAVSVQTQGGYPPVLPVTAGERALYRALREQVPIIDAAIYKLVRLIGGFEVYCPEKHTENALRGFLKTVPVNGCNMNAGDRAGQLAKEWSRAMHGPGVSDFVAVGDVQIKAIGADGQQMDSEVPVRQMLEQIVAKMGIPPFLLGLSWSSTERMSSQQADMLTSELTAYRRILEPAVLKICKTWLRLNGLDDTVEIDWNEITMQDEVDHANAAYLMAKTEQLLKEGEA